MENKKIKKNNPSLNKKAIKIKLSEAALILLKTKSFSKINIDNICKKSKIDPMIAFSVVKEKKDILYIINDYFDYEAFKDIRKIRSSNTHDQIMESLMIRFDVFNRNRSAVIKIFNYIVRKPDLIIFIIPLIIKSLTIILESSNVSSDGILGNLKVEGLLIIYISIFLIWKKDETPGLEKTMAALNNHLNKAEFFVNLFDNK